MPTTLEIAQAIAAARCATPLCDGAIAFCMRYPVAEEAIAAALAVPDDDAPELYYLQYAVMSLDEPSYSRLCDDPARGRRALANECAQYLLEWLAGLRS